MNNYFIKDGYRANEDNLTLEETSGDYWTEDRINITGQFQWYVYQEALNLMKSRNYRNLLDIGCGPGTKIKLFFTPICNDITVIDQPSMADVIQQRIPQARFIPANLEEIETTSDDKYDLIICADVLEHLVNPDKCVKFIKNSLTPHGVAVISTPERDFMRGVACDHSPKPHHVREWNSSEFARYLEYHGFTIIRHLLMPQTPLNPFEYVANKLVPESVWRRINKIAKKWGSCQTLICQLS